MSTFTGKAVLVTGAGSGIGYALCRAFASAGATVALNDSDATLAQKSAATINRELEVELVQPYACDVADVEAVRAMCRSFAATAGRLDIAIANAGIMIDAHIPGRILLMSSVTGIQPHLNLGSYGITKAGIRMMAKTIALEVSGYGITANAISPGATLTERTLSDDPEYEKHWSAITPTGRAGHVEDIVAAALYLASPEARHVTGQTIVVDGGWTLQSPLPTD